MLTSYGKVVYNPKRNMDKNIDWWCVLELKNHGLVDYYRWFLDRHWYDADVRSVKRQYCRPPHHPHISIIRGEKPRKNIEDWGKFLAGEKITFEYSNIIRQTNSIADGKDYFWFIDTFFDQYITIRYHFGLQIKRDGIPFKGHLTIARAF